MKKSPLWRLLLVLAAGVGIFFWRGGLGLLPVERSLTWKLPGAFGDIRRVDVQLYDGDSLLERTVLETPNGATFEPVTKVMLRGGEYRGLLMIWRADAGVAEVREQKIVVDADSEALSVP
ncbi:MAG: hypothetical protein IPJ65_09815 [Archangiaceae bacterium]|nr:hypothetical protein [Archangiaceae bacterium]